MAIKFKLKTLIEGKEIREDRKLTYRVIADEADVSTNTLTQMANHRMKNVGVVTIDKLCRYFDCQPGDLIIHIPDTKNE